MNKSALALFSALVALPILAHAESRKATSPYDYRIKNVVFNPMDTVEIDGVAGIATHIVTSPDETYVTHVFGDEGGWAFTHKMNHYFVRPKAAESDTNLTIVTDKRTYNIMLHYISGPPKLDANGKQMLDNAGRPMQDFAPTPWALRQATLELDYRYPGEEAKKRHASDELNRVQTELTIDPYGSGPKNFAYLESDAPSSRSIAPRNVWDDYHFTYFVFPENAELPTIFVIDSNGKESVVNTSVTGINHNIIVAQMTAAQWRVRYGDRVVGIVNQAFNPNIGAVPNGTASPLVRRIPVSGENE